MTNLIQDPLFFIKPLNINYKAKTPLCQIISETGELYQEMRQLQFSFHCHTVNTHFAKEEVNQGAISGQKNKENLKVLSCSGFKIYMHIQVEMMVTIHRIHLPRCVGLCTPPEASLSLMATKTKTGEMISITEHDSHKD